MKFVTSAYKKKLMEQKKWELQQQLEEERETRNDVTKTGMSGYVNSTPFALRSCFCHFSQRFIVAGLSLLGRSLVVQHRFGREICQKYFGRE